MNFTEFTEIQKNNPSILIVFFTAKWCKPCQTIKPYVQTKLKLCEYPYLCLDIDEHSQIYTKFKAKKQVCGVPVLLAFKQGNETVIPDFSVMGADKTKIDLFFNRLASI
jgi:thiol:disulfide interchange protein